MPNSDVTSGIARDWYTSSFTAANNTCVETRFHNDGSVDVRNSKRPEAGTVTFDADEWAAFLKGAQNGEFELP